MALEKLMEESQIIKLIKGKEYYESKIIEWTKDYNDKYNHKKHQPKNFMARQLVYLNMKIKKEAKFYGYKRIR